MWTKSANFSSNSTRISRVPFRKGGAGAGGTVLIDGINHGFKHFRMGNQSQVIVRAHHDHFFAANGDFGPHFGSVGAEVGIKAGLSHVSAAVQLFALSKISMGPLHDLGWFNQYSLNFPAYPLGAGLKPIGGANFV